MINHFLRVCRTYTIINTRHLSINIYFFNSYNYILKDVLLFYIIHIYVQLYLTRPTIPLLTVSSRYFSRPRT